MDERTELIIEFREYFRRIYREAFPESDEES